jgi:hypothetical protein
VSVKAVVHGTQRIWFIRYNDLSRMEADNILMNISEIESLNYKYVELDLLNLPRDLSTNLNEDSDNWKEHVIPSKRQKQKVT